ncbi:MAG: hypothetical protein A2939_04370 [Parcubacteria group bacterium RIFCSPLOWO2_01_FULL_48_18]|nr:MAG: hypothetical protein A3J67_03750 [Parcubacteria group bacterium RIFCSPHIGHO2_02_FULL_48_10b]OHB22618.1 MAG: hypothetical protein A2939_04370 [Parcubacteria group bacterium RIFCSPLOWO2_01_FULL_48_18]
MGNPVIVSERAPAVSASLYQDADLNEIQDVISQAQSAAEYWRYTDPRERARRLVKLGRVIDKRREEIVSVMQQEMDKPLMECWGDELGIVLGALLYCVRNGPSILVERLPSTRAQKKMLPGCRTTLYHEPMGSGIVVLQTPWNVPFQIPISDAAEALISGNTVILKPSEFTPQINALVRDVVEDAKLGDVFFQIEGGAKTSEALLAEVPEQSHVTFTGSPEVAEIIRTKCAQRNLYAHIEGGGLDAMLVFLDSDSPRSFVERTVNAAVNGRFRNCGRNCNGVKLVVLVCKDESFANTFTRMVAERAMRLRKGVDYGRFVMPYRSPRHLVLLKEQLQDAVDRGAEVFTGNHKDAMEADEYVPPVVLYNVNPSMRVFNEETFGPILPVYRVRSPQEAIGVVNSSAYKLDAYIFTRNSREAHEMRQRLKVGNVAINNVLIQYAFTQGPFSGAGGKSGESSRHGPQGILRYTRPQFVVESRLLSENENHWFPYDGDVELFGTKLRLSEKLRLSKLVGLKFAVSNFLGKPFRPRA